MSNTTDKLREARFFLEKMIEAFAHDSPELEHYANAFVASARSVTFVMQTEHAHAPAFSEWYENRKTALPDDFKELRNISLKRAPIKTDARIFEISFPEGLQIPGKAVVEVTTDLRGASVKRTTNPGTAEAKTEDIESFLIDHDIAVVERHPSGKREIEMDNFLKRSSEYLKQLELLVGECEQKFHPIP